METNEARDQLNEVGAAAQNLGESAKRTLSNVSNRLLERSKAAASTTDTYVREYAWSSVALAALLGVVVGLMIRRSD